MSQGGVRNLEDRRPPKLSNSFIDVAVGEWPAPNTTLVMSPKAHELALNQEQQALERELRQIDEKISLFDVAGALMGTDHGQQRPASAKGHGAAACPLTPVNAKPNMTPPRKREINQARLAALATPKICREHGSAQSKRSPKLFATPPTAPPNGELRNERPRAALTSVPDLSMLPELPSGEVSPPPTQRAWVHAPGKTRAPPGKTDANETKLFMPESAASGAMRWARAREGVSLAEVVEVRSGAVPVPSILASDSNPDFTLEEELVRTIAHMHLPHHELPVAEAASTSQALLRFKTLLVRFSDVASMAAVSSTVDGRAKGHRHPKAPPVDSELSWQSTT